MGTSGQRGGGQGRILSILAKLVTCFGLIRTLRGAERRSSFPPPALREGGVEVESASIAAPTAAPPERSSAPGEKGLKAGALGYMSNLVIAVASTAPAYSLATTLGFIVAVQGITTHAPAVLLVSFVP